jgi:hypothetical protein
VLKTKFQNFPLQEQQKSPGKSGKISPEILRYLVVAWNFSVTIQKHPQIKPKTSKVEREESE